MATASFDERVVVTDREIIAEMKRDLDDPTPVVIKHKTNLGYITLEQAEENGKKLARRLMRIPQN